MRPGRDAPRWLSSGKSAWASKLAARTGQYVRVWAGVHPKDVGGAPGVWGQARTLQHELAAVQLRGGQFAAEAVHGRELLMLAAAPLFATNRQAWAKPACSRVSKVATELSSAQPALVGAVGRWFAREAPKVVSPHGLKPYPAPQPPRVPPTCVCPLLRDHLRKSRGLCERALQGGEFGAADVGSGSKAGAATGKVCRPGAGCRPNQLISPVVQQQRLLVPPTCSTYRWVSAPRGLLEPAGVAAGIAGAVALHARLGCDRFDNVAPGRAVTRPRGVTVGDFLDKPRADGGLEMSRYVAAAVLAVLILAAITLLPKRAERVRVAD